MALTEGGESTETYSPGSRVWRNTNGAQASQWRRINAWVERPQRQWKVPSFPKQGSRRTAAAVIGLALTVCSAQYGFRWRLQGCTHRRSCVAPFVALFFARALSQQEKKNQKKKTTNAAMRCLKGDGNDRRRGCGASDGRQGWLVRPAVIGDWDARPFDMGSPVPVPILAQRARWDDGGFDLFFFAGALFPRSPVSCFANLAAPVRSDSRLRSP
jgi:hypothetical protein